MSMHEIKCPCCEGEGRIPLALHLEKTLATFKGYTTATQIAHSLSISVPAANHRLIDLVSLGLLTRQQAGNGYIYTRTKKGR